MKRDDPVCLCFHVTRRKLENFTRVHQPAVASRLSECGGAGTGCGWCIPLLKRIHAAGTRANDVLDPLDSAVHAAGRDEHLRQRRVE